MVSQAWFKIVCLLLTLLLVLRRYIFLLHMHSDSNRINHRVTRDSMIIIIIVIIISTFLLKNMTSVAVYYLFILSCLQSEYFPDICRARLAMKTSRIKILWSLNSQI